MVIDVASKRKVKGGGRYNGGGISDLDGMGVGKLALTADDADDRKFITSIYRCIAPVRPLTREQNAVDRAAVKHLRGWLRYFEKDVLTKRIKETTNETHK